jgi:hypothetical protein
MVSSRFRTALALTLDRAFLSFFPFDVRCRGGGRSSGYAPRSAAAGSSHRSALSSRRSSIMCERYPRDRWGKITRDRNAGSEFRRIGMTRATGSGGRGRAPGQDAAGCPETGARPRSALRCVTGAQGRMRGPWGGADAGAQHRPHRRRR